MPTSAEQFHHNLLNPAPAKAESRLLYIDLDVCTSGDCGSCNLKCSYASLEKNNNGIASVAELATMVLVCRKCEEAHCVAACPVEALERRDEEGKVLVRHNLRCVGCTSCSHACPYAFRRAPTGRSSCCRPTRPGVKTPIWWGTT
jgi:Fe-S-cluster-containing dehydrogenase component